MMAMLPAGEFISASQRDATQRNATQCKKQMNSCLLFANANPFSAQRLIISMMVPVSL
jgi:hypothetical protein